MGRGYAAEAPRHVRLRPLGLGEEKAAPVYAYEKDQEGNLILDENGNPIVTVIEGDEIPVTYLRNEDGELILDEKGDPIPTQTVPTDAVISRINSLGFREIWDDASPVWFRPQYNKERMYREKDLLQVVGHTPVMEIERTGNVFSCDLFSTYRSGDPIGTREFILIDTVTWRYQGIK